MPHRPRGVSRVCRGSEAPRHHQTCTGGVPLLSSLGGPSSCTPWGTHMEIPILFTPGCPVPRVGTVVQNAQQGRNSSWLLNLIPLSNLQQRWLARAALILVDLDPRLDPGIGAPRRAGVGHRGRALQQPSSPASPRCRGGRGVPVGTPAARCPGCGLWHRGQLAASPACGRVVPHSGGLAAPLWPPSCGFWDAQGARHTCA